MEKVRDDLRTAKSRLQVRQKHMIKYTVKKVLIYKICTIKVVQSIKIHFCGY